MLSDLRNSRSKEITEHLLSNDDSFDEYAMLSVAQPNTTIQQEDNNEEMLMNFFEFENNDVQS